MSTSDVWTIGRLLTWTADFLKQHGAEAPRLDAEVLLAEARGCKRIDLYARFDEPADDRTRAAYRELVRRRAEGTPVAYLVGRREFYSLMFRVTPDVLIPRPETEFVVLALLDRVKERPAGSAPPTIADVGTGSGILAICAAKYISGSHVTAIDVSGAALEVARANAADHDMLDRVEFVESDLFAAVPVERRFDFIVSNPPYVREGEWPALAREVRDHEPRRALIAGPRGTEVIARLIDESAARLTSGGWLLVEISPMIAAEVAQLLQDDPRFGVAPTIKDLQGHARVVQAQRRGAVA